MRDGSRRQREQAQASNISSRGRRQQSRRRQRCIRRQRQQQEEAAAASAAAVEQEQEAAVKGTSCNNIWVLEQAVQDVACLFRLHDSSFAAHGCRGQVLDKRIFLLKPYRFGYRSVIVLGYVFPTFLCMLKLRCSVTRKGRQGGQAASGQLGCLARQLGCATVAAWLLDCLAAW